jgi:putative spermidine/putrescine transport system permease protein
LWRGVVLALAALYFFVPLLASLIFSVAIPGQSINFSAYTTLFSADGFLSSLTLSLELAVVTIVIVMLILVPALVAVRLSVPKLRPAIEILCSAPLVVPAIALVGGIGTVLKWGPNQLAQTPFYQTILAIQNPKFPIVLVLAYVVMALPLAYRALDAGLQSLDLRTLVEASRSCGASWTATMFSVVLPNLRGALLNASFLTLALVLGEFTAANILGFTTFSVWLVTAGSSQAQLSVATSVMSLVLVWVLLLIVSTVGNRRTRTSS